IGGVVNVQNPSACFSMSAFGPLQKFTRTFAASGALKRISTRELLSTRGYCASRTLDVAGLKSPSCATQKCYDASISITNAFIRISSPCFYRNRVRLTASPTTPPFYQVIKQGDGVSQQC